MIDGNVIGVYEISKGSPDGKQNACQLASEQARIIEERGHYAEMHFSTALNDNQFVVSVFIVERGN